METGDMKGNLANVDANQLGGVGFEQTPTGSANEL